MAEYCLECFNEINDIKLFEREVKFSRNLNLCEGCIQRKLVIVRIKRRGWRRIFKKS